MAQKSPQRILAPDTTTSNPATFIFLHGLGDDADGWVNIAEQFHSASKLPHLTWLFPNAPHNHEAMTNAWYTPTDFSPIPVGRSSSASTSKDEPDDEGEEEYKDEILTSVEYVCELIDEEVKRGVQLNRIVVGGFSQGCAISLITGLGLESRYAGKIRAIVGLSGYLPKLKIMKKAGGNVDEGGSGGNGPSGTMDAFLAHGSKDMLVPMRIFRECKTKVGVAVGVEALETHEYQGMGHVTSGAEFRDMCEFLEKVIPP